MVNYRRHFGPGGTFFFTVALQDRGSRLLVDHIGELRDAFQGTREKRPFRIEAMVVLPEHMHTIWTLSRRDRDYAGRWQAIKSGFVRGLQQAGVDIDRRSDGRARVWQYGCWEHTIRDQADLRRYIDYVHFDPVKHGWVERVADWPHSSFHRYVRAGLLPPDWGPDGPVEADVVEPGEETLTGSG